MTSVDICPRLFKLSKKHILMMKTLNIASWIANMTPVDICPGFLRLHQEHTFIIKLNLKQNILSSQYNTGRYLH